MLSHGDREWRGNRRRDDGGTYPAAETWGEVNEKNIFACDGDAASTSNEQLSRLHSLERARHHLTRGSETE